MHVGQLLHLQSSLKTGGKIEPSSHDEERFLLVELLRYLLHLLVQLEHLLDEVRQLLQSLDDLGPPGLEGDPVLGHDEGEHDEAEHLTGVGLGAGHSDLGPGVDVNSCMALPTYGGAHSVGDAQDEGTARLAVPEGAGRVS